MLSLRSPRGFVNLSCNECVFFFFWDIYPTELLIYGRVLLLVALRDTRAPRHPEIGKTFWNQGHMPTRKHTDLHQAQDHTPHRTYVRSPHAAYRDEFRRCFRSQSWGVFSAWTKNKYDDVVASLALVWRKHTDLLMIFIESENILSRYLSN